MGRALGLALSIMKMKEGSLFSVRPCVTKCHREVVEKTPGFHDYTHR